MEDPQFTALAPLYDALMSGIPYDEWVEYVQALAQRHGHAMRRVLDVGCGTGSAALLLARAGMDVTGIDASEAMVLEARRKAGDLRGVAFHVARMEALDFDDRFDTAVSLFDSVNYVTEPAHLREAFHRIRRHLAAGGLFIFDMNTPYALEMELFTQDNLRTLDEPKYVWKSRYDWRSRMATVDMTFYVKQGNTRVTVKETHRQRAYTLEEISLWLREAGFDILDVLQAYSFRPPLPHTDRAFFVARAPLVKGS